MREHKLPPQRYFIPLSTALIGQIGVRLGLDGEVIVEQVLVESDGVGAGVAEGLVDEEEREVEVYLGVCRQVGEGLVDVGERHTD